MEERYIGLISAGDRVIAEAWVNLLTPQVTDILHMALATAVKAGIARSGVVTSSHDAVVNSEEILKLLRRWDEEGMPQQPFIEGGQVGIDKNSLYRDIAKSIEHLGPSEPPKEYRTPHEFEQDRLRTIAGACDKAALWAQVYGIEYARLHSNYPTNMVASRAIEAANNAVLELAKWLAE